MAEFEAPPMEAEASKDWADFGERELPSVDAEAAPPEVEDIIPEPREAAVAAAPPSAAINLSEAQIEAIVARVFERVIERIAWEVVPDLAERIIKEELARLTQEKP